MYKMTPALKIINNAYHEAGGFGYYEYPIMPDNLKNKGSLPNSIKDLLGIKGRKNIRLKTRDIDVIVFEYRKTKNELLYIALIENYLDLLVKLHRTYRDKATGIKYKDNDNIYYDEDLLNEGFALLHKCLLRYKNDKPNSSFTSYFLGEYSNCMIETCRRVYFPVVKIPSAIYKQYRRQLHMKNLSKNDEVGIAQKSNSCISDTCETSDYAELFSFEYEDNTKYYDSEDDAKNKITKILKKYLTEEEMFIFVNTTGLFCDKKKGCEVSKILGISEPAVSKKLKRAKSILRDCPEIQDLYNYYRDYNILNKNG